MPAWTAGINKEVSIMFKKIIIVLAAAAMLVSCGEPPVATLDPEGVENTITEKVIVEEVIE